MKDKINDIDGTFHCINVFAVRCKQSSIRLIFLIVIIVVVVVVVVVVIVTTIAVVIWISG
jgi:hypothetical protein